MTDTLRDRAVQIYDAFTHEHHDRRTLLRQMTVLAGTAAAAEALILGIAASPAAAAISDPKDRRLRTSKGRYAIGQGRSLIGYHAAPRKRTVPPGAVMVIHENRGLTPHIEDVTRRIALAGFVALAPDFLTPQGGTPADQDAARELIGKIDYDAAIADGVGTIRRLARSSRSTGKVGAIGFCWGGAYVDRVALAAGASVAGGGLAGGVSYYGPAPAPAEAARLQVPLVLQLAGKDARVNTSALPFAQAGQDAGKSVVAYTYEGVDHAFNNDTSAERYDAAAADLAWGRTIAFLTRVLS